MRHPITSCTSLLCLILVSSAVSARHGVLHYEEHNCSMTLLGQSGWHGVATDPETDEVFSASNGTGTKSVVLMVTPQGPMPFALNDEFIRGFEEGALKAPEGSTVEKVSGQRIRVDGVPAYELVANMSLAEGGQSTSRVWVLPAGGKVYALTAIAKNGVSIDDDELMAVMGSFRFLRRPADPPAGNTSQPAVEGSFWRIALVLCAIVGFALLLGLVFWLRERRRGRLIGP